MEAQLLKVRNRMGICSRGPKLHAKCMVAVWGIKIFALKAPVQWRWSYTILHFPQKINPHFYFFGTIFHYFHPAPPNMGVFGPFFAIRNEFHTIGVECGSSMVGMQPWFTCSLGLHALCSLHAELQMQMQPSRVCLHAAMVFMQPWLRFACTV